MRSLGHGPEPVVALHCTLAHGGVWAPMTANLSNQVTVLAPDLPGHGDRPDWESGGDFMAASLETLAELPQEPCHVLGHSFGAVVALEYALRTPERVLSLTLVEPVLFAAAASAQGRMEAANEWRELERLSHAQDREAAAKYFTDTWGAGLPWECLPRPARARIVEQIHIVTDQTATLHHDGAGILSPGRLEALTVPVTIVSGSDSPDVVRDIAGALASRMPRARRVEIDGAGHMLPLNHPAEMADVLGQSIEAGRVPFS
ncbi:alpha/beta fold hydrolase [Aliiruegeria lutimaris]|uniref:Pimeloyl-ACP methyl ester carboxylesterase n=1 Tax=Aliiruegeria lutimaris TaxID=571298 RepID=A0A1G9C5K9_9RHOB|nr:alpha/beta hydrolase [Aliiruegeria lutimaris]SDK46972.1 Pimeloyl-ACP methyl ester carboxylesterase [Aliiruegeria lutimaris]